MVEVQKRIAEKKSGGNNRKIEESSYIDRAAGLLGSNIARIKFHGRIIDCSGEGGKLKRFLSIPLKISAFESAIIKL